jgi:hypothetical protein
MTTTDKMAANYYTTRDVKNEMIVQPKKAVLIVSTRIKHMPILPDSLTVKLYRKDGKKRKELCSVSFDNSGEVSLSVTPSRARYSIDSNTTHLDTRTGHVYVGLLGRPPKTIEIMSDYEYDASDELPVMRSIFDVADSTEVVRKTVMDDFCRARNRPR